MQLPPAPDSAALALLAGAGEPLLTRFADNIAEIKRQLEELKNQTQFQALPDNPA